MKFIEKHPYLFWQITGLLIILTVVLITICTDAVDNENALLILLFSFWGGILINMLSPVFIRINGADKREKYFNRIIMQIHEQKHGKKQLLFSCIAGLCLFITLSVIFNSQNALLEKYEFMYLLIIPISAALGTIPVIIYYAAVKSSFYRVKKAERFCKIIDINYPEVLDSFYTKNSLLFYDENDKRFFRFIYNYCRVLKILRQQEICFYRFNYGMLNSKYGFEFNCPEKHLLCTDYEYISYSGRNLCIALSSADSFKNFIDRYKGLQKFAETNVCASRRIIEENMPVLYVLHGADGDLKFLCEKNQRAEDTMTVPLRCVLNKDPWLLYLITELPNGYSAERKNEKQDWKYTDENQIPENN